VNKIDAFELQVEKGSKFSFLSIASFLGDFCIGNTIEKNAALKTAKERRVQLNDLAASKNCIVWRLMESRACPTGVNWFGINRGRDYMKSAFYLP